MTILNICLCSFYVSGPVRALFQRFCGVCEFSRAYIILAAAYKTVRDCLFAKLLLFALFVLMQFAVALGREVFDGFANNCRFLEQKHLSFGQEVPRTRYNRF